MASVLTVGPIRWQSVCRTARRLALLLVVALLTACSTTRPWRNAPIDASASAEVAPIVKPMLPVDDRANPPMVIAAIALSGGGARAAAFGLGVLEELKATRLVLDGRPTTLLDEVGLVSGVSGRRIPEFDDSMSHLGRYL